MSEKVIVLCDPEEEYARHMSEFIKRQREVPLEIHIYTDTRELLAFAANGAVELLIVAESAFSEQIRALRTGRTLLLNETGLLKWPDILNVDKYQSADQVWREIRAAYLEIAPLQFPRLVCGSGPRLIGMYSPIRRCLQTSFALTMGQLLAERHRTLYLNFEHYAGITELLPDRQTKDLADVLYFLTADKDKFLLRLQTMIRKKGDLDYIPPVNSGQTLLGVTREEWLGLLERVGDLGEYEYVILDLTENTQGLFDILRRCFAVLTLEKEDERAKGKLLQYEQTLALYEYGDVLTKTHRYIPPVFRKLPGDIEQLTRSDLAGYVRRVIKEVLEIGLPEDQELPSGEGSGADGLRQRDDG